MFLDEYCKTNNIRFDQVAKELGCSYEDIRRYVNRQVIPRQERLKKIIKWSHGAIQPNDFYLEKEEE